MFVHGLVLGSSAVHHLELFAQQTSCPLKAARESVRQFTDPQGKQSDCISCYKMVMACHVNWQRDLRCWQGGCCWVGDWLCDGLGWKFKVRNQFSSVQSPWEKSPVFSSKVFMSQKLSSRLSVMNHSGEKKKKKKEQGVTSP